MDLTAEALADSKAAIDRQASRVDEIRARTGTIYAASNISAGVLGVSADKLTAATALGAVAFVVATVAALWTLRARDGWKFARSGLELWTGFAETSAADTEAAMRFRLEHLEEDHEVNESMLTVLHRGLMVLIVAVGCQTAFLFYALLTK